MMCGPMNAMPSRKSSISEPTTSFGLNRRNRKKDEIFDGLFFVTLESAKGLDLTASNRPRPRPPSSSSPTSCAPPPATTVLRRRRRRPQQGGGFDEVVARHRPGHLDEPVRRPGGVGEELGAGQLGLHRGVSEGRRSRASIVGSVLLGGSTDVGPCSARPGRRIRWCTRPRSSARPSWPRPCPDWSRCPATTSRWRSAATGSDPAACSRSGVGSSTSTTGPSERRRSGSARSRRRPGPPAYR